MAMCEVQLIVDKQKSLGRILMRIYQPIPLITEVINPLLWRIYQDYDKESRLTFDGIRRINRHRLIMAEIGRKIREYNF
jgi:hypothetical protein